MAGLLQLAGMKPRRPRWYGFLLIVTALVPVVAAVFIGIEHTWADVAISSDRLGMCCDYVLRFEAHRKQ